MKRYRWELKSYAAASQGLETALSQGWEPFAVIVEVREVRVFVRRRVWK